MRFDAQQMNDIGLLLAKACALNGGPLEVAEGEAEGILEQYGSPIPLILGRDERGCFAALYTLEEFIEKGAPWLARSMDLPIELATAAAKAISAQLELLQAQVRYAEDRGPSVQEDAVATLERISAELRNRAMGLGPNGEEPGQG